MWKRTGMGELSKGTYKRGGSEGQAYYWDRVTLQR